MSQSLVNESGGAKHAALRPAWRRCIVLRRGALPLGPAARPAEAGARRDRARRRDGALQDLRLAAALALQPRGGGGRVRGAARRARLGAAARRADRRRDLARCCCCGARAAPHATELGRVPGTDYWADAAATSGERASAGRLRVPLRGVAALLQRRERARPLLRAAERARRGREARGVLPRHGADDRLWPAPSCSRRSTTRSPSAASRCGWPRRAATCARPCGAPASRSAAARSRRTSRCRGSWRSGGARSAAPADAERCVTHGALLRAGSSASMRSKASRSRARRSSGVSPTIDLGLPEARPDAAPGARLDEQQRDRAVAHRRVDALGG